MDNTVIGYLVDSTVGALNRKYGQDWGVTNKSRAAEIVRENAGK